MTTSASSFSFCAGGGFKFSLGSGQNSDTAFTGKKLSCVAFLLISALLFIGIQVVNGYGIKDRVFTIALLT